MAGGGWLGVCVWQAVGGNSDSVTIQRLFQQMVCALAHVPKPESRKLKPETRAH